VFAGLERWLDFVFWGGMELSVLANPALLVLLGATPPGPIALSALTALVVGSASIGSYRGGYVGSTDWPRPGDFGTMAGRSAYYSIVVAAATYAGAEANVATGLFWAGVFVPAVLAAATLAPLPRVLDDLRQLSRRGVESETWP
jgi:hypothetical protein